MNCLQRALTPRVPVADSVDLVEILNLDDACSWEAAHCLLVASVASLIHQYAALRGPHALPSICLASLTSVLQCFRVLRQTVPAECRQPMFYHILTLHRQGMQ
jgi:hypothetical protein